MNNVTNLSLEVKEKLCTEIKGVETGVNEVNNLIKLLVASQENNVDSSLKMVLDMINEKTDKLLKKDISKLNSSILSLNVETSKTVARRARQVKKDNNNVNKSASRVSRNNRVKKQEVKEEQAEKIEVKAKEE